ncbi:hypothetical protein DET57_10931 [Klebsiella oxytoca]|uniref:Uncharacterized protein n=1 Tax=Klebsiella oxytoca TaxID=571 RepID=A0A318FP43_KLEOX|nr:hypothetical protein [Klebsiella oxytoca]PXW44348.1 hypothetical protein DET57_10931 [Klebsiella oxytoca]HCB1500577.1 hypothetical protein [Klebsiella michiganensis]HCB1846742.1 hypothetical protein [Klebsiella oxytoca]
MFSTIKRRLLFLAIVTLAAFLWSATFSFNLFLPNISWRQHQMSGEEKEVEDPIISSFANGALFISHEQLFTVKRYELDKQQRRVIHHYNPPLERITPLMPQLLNVRLVAKEQLERDIKGRYNRFTSTDRGDDRFNIPLTSIMHLDRQGQLQTSALWLGDIDDPVCTLQGECYLIADGPFHTNKSVWYSPDGGISWQQLTQWRFPEPDMPSRFYSQKLVSAEAGKLWLADQYTLSVSEDQGHSWQIAADIRPLLKRNTIQWDNTAEQSVRLSRLRWYIDNRQRLLADVTVSLAEDRGERRFLYNVVSSQQEQILATNIRDIARSPRGEIFFISRISASRYGLYRLQENGAPGLVLEHIDRLGKIYAGRNLLAVEKDIGDSAHLYLSRDRGQQWQRYKLPGKNVVFDGEGDRFIRFPLYYRTLNYQISTFE